MAYVILYADEKGMNHKRSAKTKAQACYIKKKIVRDLAEANYQKTVDNLKVGFDVDIKTEDDVETILKDLEKTFENRVVIITENQWKNFMKNKQIVRVPELGQFIITDASVDFSEKEEYENLLNFLQERDKV